jgi:hypothetical protein
MTTEGDAMSRIETAGNALRGRYRDVLRDPGGEVIWDRGWCDNAIVADCRRLLASFLRGDTDSAGILGLHVGSGSVDWDASSPPQAKPTQVALEDPKPFLVPIDALQIDFLDGAAPSATPTTRLQIAAKIGPGVPPWPEGNPVIHPAANLREFGLVGQLNGTTVLVNYVTHPVIAKDPLSTLERTIWLQL